MASKRKGNKTSVTTKVGKAGMLAGLKRSDRKKTVKIQAAIIVLAALFVATLTINHGSLPSLKSDNGKNYIAIKQLGIKIERTEAMKNWQFVEDTRPSEPMSPEDAANLGPPPVWMYIQTFEYTQIVGQCHKDKPVAADEELDDTSVTAFYRAEGDYDSFGLSFDSPAKQFQAFFIARSQSSGNTSCTDEPSRQKLDAIQVEVNKALDHALENARAL